MKPMGSQQDDMRDAPRVQLTDAGDFYERYVASGEPVVVVGAASAATGHRAWDDAFLQRMCLLDDGREVGQHLRWRLR